MSAMKNAKFQELVAKLREIFQIDRPELDFGIYRILNARADEINEYLERRLPEKVQTALNSGNAAQSEQVVRELKEKEEQYTADGIDPNNVPKVQELRQKLAAYSQTALAKSEELAKQAKFVEFATSRQFQETYLKRLNF